MIVVLLFSVGGESSFFNVFSLKFCWWCEIQWLLMEFGVAKELVVECAVWVAVQLDLVFVFLKIKILCKILVFWFLFQGFKVFCVCFDVFMLREMNVMTNKWCTSFMKAWFHKLGTHIRTFWLRICKSKLHYDKKVMYNLFMNYTHSNICTRKKHECKLKFQI